VKTELKAKIDRLTSRCVDEILDAMRSAPLGQIFGAE
jgi:hypothetical protein